MGAHNLNLFFSLLGAAVTVFLGIVVYFHERKSFTNVVFVLHSLVGTVWAIVNYFSIVVSPDSVLFWIRGVIFFAVPYVFLFFLFVLNFPNVNLVVKKGVFFGILILMFAMMFLASSPYVFQEIKITNGKVIPVVGPLIGFFGPVLVLVFLLAAVFVFRRYFQSGDVARRQWLSIGTGLLAAYTLLIFFVFLRVVLFDDTTFVTYSPLFILPVFVGAAYAILRHHLFNVKVIAAEILTFGLVVVSLVQVFLAEQTTSLILAFFATVGSLYFGILLIKSVLREVEQREKLQKLSEDLQAANVKLEELSRFKTQLLSLASHQVKSPLAAIKGYASILLEGLYGPVSDKVKVVLQKMKASTDGLISLVDMLLDLRRVEEGKMEYQFVKTDMKKLVTDTVEELRPLAMEKRLSLDFVAPQGEVFVSADAQKLKQVIQNLLDNAIKYTEHGFVKVDLRDDVSAHAAMVTVSDSGLGIPHDLMPYLFEEFVRDERVKKEIRGTGFGLYIARKIVEAHGGKIFAESKGPNCGSSFHVALPRVG